MSSLLSCCSNSRSNPKAITISEEKYIHGTSICYKVLKNLSILSFPPFENKPDMCEKVNIWLIQFCIGKEVSFQLKRQIQF